MSARDGVTDGDQSTPYPFHPLANIFPLMEGNQLNVLVEDVRTNGLNDEIVLHEGTVLDGRTRLRACIAAGVPYRTVPFKGTDPIAFVISANVHRRHLTNRQRAIAAAKLSNLPVGRLKENAPIGGISPAATAKFFGVSLRSVQRAATLLQCANPDLVEMITNGRLSISAAANQSIHSTTVSSVKPAVSAKRQPARREGAQPPQPLKQTVNQSLDGETPAVGLFGDDPLPDVGPVVN